jgi:hypothetical protein
MLMVLGVRNPQSTACDVWCLCVQDQRVSSLRLLTNSTECGIFVCKEHRTVASSNWLGNYCCRRILPKTNTCPNSCQSSRCLLVACLPKSDLSFPSDHRSVDDNWNCGLAWFLNNHAIAPRSELQTEFLCQRL